MDIRKKASGIIIPGQYASSDVPADADRFRRFMQTVSHGSGRPLAFALGAAAVVVWAMLGPLFGYSEQWMLLADTGTAIVTFLMVFVIQNSQARESKELRLKIDELLRAVGPARNHLIASGELSDAELHDHEIELRRMAGRPAGTPPEGPEHPLVPGMRDHHRR